MEGIEWPGTASRRLHAPLGGADRTIKMGTTMRKFLGEISVLVLTGALASAAAHAQVPRGNEYEGEVSTRAYTPVTKRTKIPTKQTFIPLSNNANAVMLEP